MSTPHTTLKQLACIIRNEIGNKQSEYEVVLHGLYKMRRGKKPSLVFNGIKNPRKAFEYACKEIGFPCDSTSARVLFDKAFCRIHGIPFLFEDLGIYTPVNYASSTRFYIEKMRGACASNSMLAS